MAELLPTLEHATGADPEYAIIWLHGLGADAHDFESLVPQLVRPGWPSIRFLFPNAPIRPISLNGGLPMRAWYDVAGFDLSQKQDAAGIRTSVAAVEALIACEAERGIAASNVILAGFSQGGAIALAAGVRHAEKLAAVVALSTYLPIADATADERSVASTAMPIFMGHGTFDPVVPSVLGERSRDALQAWGYPVAWHRYLMAHQVCPQEIDDLAEFLAQRFT